MFSIITKCVDIVFYVTQYVLYRGEWIMFVLSRGFLGNRWSNLIWKWTPFLVAPEAPKGAEDDDDEIDAVIDKTKKTAKREQRKRLFALKKKAARLASEQ